MRFRIHPRSFAHSMIFFTTIILLLPAVHVLAGEGSEPADPSASPWFGDVLFNGFFSASYSYNFNEPASGMNQFRVFDSDDNSFKVDVAQLVLRSASPLPGQSGFRLDFTAGSSIPRRAASYGLFRDETADQGEDFDLQQFYVSYIAPFGRGIQFDLGKQTSKIGYEVIEGYDGYNDNATRSLLFGYAIPLTLTGLWAGYEFSDNVSASVFIVNGWDNVKDNNRDKTLGGQLLMTPTSKVTVRGSYVVGPERADNDSDLRSLYDAVGILKAAPRVTLGLNVSYGTEQEAAPSGGDATWSGVAGYLRLDLNEKFAVALRGEQFDDRDGARTGGKQRLTAITATPEYRLSDKVLLRGDLRMDQSDREVYEKASSFQDSQMTAGLNAILLF